MHCRIPEKIGEACYEVRPPQCLSHAKAKPSAQPGEYGNEDIGRKTEGGIRMEWAPDLAVELRLNPGAVAQFHP